FGLLEHGDDLAIGEAGLLHGTSSGKRTRKFHFWDQLICGGITAEVVIHSWQPGIQVVSCIEALHKHSALSLKASAAVMESVLGGTSQTVAVATQSEATDLSDILVGLGALAHVASAA
ncbi:hypothetical protein LDO26_18100, partial [Luteimonas sp. BDR2-5]|uniref:hypothetical protein n=1 Tax=Proluteimonas luteida TaxID=2878685 RepID=UPI001E583518